MPGKVVLLLLAFLVLVSFHSGGPGSLPDRIVKLYHQADSLYHLADPTAATDSTALAGFGQVIDKLATGPDFAGKDTLLLHSWLKKGILLDSRNSYTGAKEAYLEALRLNKTTDSLSFVAYVYAGACYYNLNNFDSARYFLLKAEPLVNRFHDPQDEVRLYNTLGVLFYDNGNYKQGKNYFSRALEIVKSRQPLDTPSAVSIETNIATSYYRLGAYQESINQYNSILRFHVFANYVYMNMGRAYTALNKYQQALGSFRKVIVAGMPWVLNEMAHTELQLQRKDSCAYFLDRLLPYKNAGKLNDLDIGINEQYRADLLNDRQQYPAALASLQRAIIIFSGGFHDTDIFSNPSSFTGTFTYYRLFDALLEKARIFERLYRTQPKEQWLSASYAAYRTALSVLRYIEKSYDTDDAKLFLKKKSGQAYQEALSVCLDLYRLHPRGNFLEQAYSISESNKASIIAAGLKERDRGAVPGMEDGLLQNERNIKYNIARLNVKTEESRNAHDLDSMAREKAGYEIGLSHLQKQLEKNGDYYRLKYEDSTPGIAALQQRLGGTQALISFSATPEAMHVFVVTKNAFSYARIDSLGMLQRDIADWLSLLKTTGSGRKFRGEAIGARLYKQLIQPIQALTLQKDEWIIIPDGILYFLPFESLPAGEGSKSPDGSRTLLETTTISYQFSTSLMVNTATGEATTRAAAPGGSIDYKVLSFAPFAAPFPAQAREPGHDEFNPLPASGEEIAGLPGRVYLDTAATKARFLQEMNGYPIIHLATHAVSAVNNAAESFIAFYPEKKSRAEDCLFLEELYGLNMSGTRLVIISACETGQGELVSNEGVISLARAFTYAGCASTVCSLWKADDKATSFILKRFHHYLQEGYSKSKALRSAKLDYLGSDAVNKSPAFWSHLILIGNEDAVCSARHSYKWAVMILASGLLVAAVLLLLARGRRKKKKSTLFMDGGF